MDAQVRRLRSLKQEVGMNEFKDSTELIAALFKSARLLPEGTIKL